MSSSSGLCPQRCLLMPLSAWGVDSARWREGGEEGRVGGSMLGLPCLPEAGGRRPRPTGWRPQGLPDPPLGGKEL